MASDDNRGEKTQKERKGKKDLQGSDPAAALAGTTTILVDKAKKGDLSAKERLIEKYRRPLTKLAHGELPADSRSLLDTDDLVQDVIVKALEQLDRYRHRRKHGFFWFLWRMLKNQVIDETRRSRHRRPHEELDDSPLLAKTRSPLEHYIEKESLERYEDALKKLPLERREEIVAWIQFGLTYREIAEELGRPSEDAVRMAIKRSLTRLAKEMRPSKPCREKDNASSW